MLAKLAVDTVATLKNLTGSDKIHGLPLVVMSKLAWYVLDLASTEAADDDLIILPNDGVGRWFKLNNNTNVRNIANIITTSSSSTTLDFTNYDEISLVFTQNTGILFNASIRNGVFNLILNRNGGSWTISSWDARIRWASSAYSFGSGINMTVLSFVSMNDVIYNSSIREFT